ncbi:MAG: hypothetical protein A3F46_00270 [Legionellales bacterium RIFCSPHIGHO2_12_FULL_42_9]|nr:MAG: hypothetical protein A3F46_00270 [Legionellales bacterium RIFCSPHIGHO2_12_FULL_42_9]
MVNWSAAELPRKLLYSEERQLLEKVILGVEERASVIKQIKGNSLNYEQRLQDKLSAGSISQEEHDKVAPLFPKLNTLFPSYGLVDRGENLDASEKDGEFCIKKRRIANSVFAPSVMSLSVLTNGSNYFNTPGTERTKIETDNSSRPVVNPEEGEILVPQGTSYLYTQNPNGGFFAREINSPGIIPKGGYWSSTAIAEAYRNHLSQPYLQSPQQITIDGITIHRPNHGLAHEYRVMIYIDLVIDYFAHHAKNESFKSFCQFITEDEREWLRVAAAYSVTGRESEIAFNDNPALYDDYRKACTIHMEAFLAKYPPPSADETMRERLLDSVRWMGNPGYEHEHLDKPAINQHPDPHERQHRNFIHRILSLAHNVDLPRCYGPQQFNTAMEIAREHMTQSHEQQADYTRMIRYAIDLIDAHGNGLYMDITPSGELIACSKDYREPFHKVSSNLRQLREITETIPYPKLTEQYQFQESENKIRLV